MSWEVIIRIIIIRKIHIYEEEKGSFLLPSSSGEISPFEEEESRRKKAGGRKQSLLTPPSLTHS
jgi:hypothetical protein